MDSRRPGPKSGGGIGVMVITEWRRPPAVGLAFCVSVERNSTSFELMLVSPPTSDSRRTWLAVMPSVICSDGSECLRRCIMSGNGHNRYGLTGEPGSDSSLFEPLPTLGSQPPVAPSSTSSSRGGCVSSTTINGSWVLILNTGVNDERRILAAVVVVVV